MKFARSHLARLVLFAIVLFAALSLGSSSTTSFTPGVLTLETFGANGDGLSPTADSAAMTALTAALTRAAKMGGATLQLGCGRSYDVSNGAPYTLPQGSSVLGCGDSSIVKNTANQPTFIVGGTDVTVRGVRFLGNSTGANQVQIADAPATGGTGYKGLRIDNVTFDSPGGAGALVYNVTGIVPLWTALITNVKVINPATYGLWLYGEYTTVSGFQVACNTLSGSIEGVEIANGNVVLANGTITQCPIGLRLVGGGNDAHGVISNVLINHNATNIKATNAVANGEPFVGCDVYEGDINLISSTGVHFIGGHVDPNNYYFDGSTGTVFDAVTFPQSYTNTIHNSYNSHASTTRWDPNCSNLAGMFPAFIAAGDDGSAWNQSFGGSGQTTFGGGSGVYPVSVGPLVGATTSFGAMYMLSPGTTRATGNASMFSDGNNLYFNLRSGSYKFFWQYVASTNVMVLDPTGDVGTLDLSTWQFGTTISTGTMGTKKAGASYVLQGDNQVTGLTLSNAKSVVTTTGARVHTQVTKGANYTIDSGSTNDDQVWMTAASTLTLPDPTAFGAGRALEVIVDYDPTASGGTIARHGGESINGAAANLTLGAADKFSVLSVRTNAADWVIGLSTKAP